MTTRTDHALAHPADDPIQATRPDLCCDEVQRDGNTLRSILAVDR